MAIKTKVEQKEPTLLGTIMFGGLNIIATDLAGGYGYKATAINTETGEKVTAEGDTAKEAEWNAINKITD